MVCAMSCAIAFVFIVANVYCCSFGHKTQVIQDFVAKLSPENQNRYAVITKERQGIYFMGLFLGFILAMILMVCCRKYFIGSRGGILCMIAAVTFSVNYFYYIYLLSVLFFITYMFISLVPNIRPKSSFSFKNQTAFSMGYQFLRR